MGFSRPRALCAQWCAMPARPDSRTKRIRVEISTEAVESILAHPGEPIFRETGAARAGRRIFAISHHFGASDRECLPGGRSAQKDLLRRR